MTFPRENGVTDVAYPNIPAVLEAVQAGDVRYGVVPYYNSTHGAVTATLDSLTSELQQQASSKVTKGIDAGGEPAHGKAALNILQEVVVPIRHCLLGYDPDGSSRSLRGRTPSLKYLKKVFSHEQALGQCVRFLAEHTSEAEQVSVSSTSRAAEMVRDIRSTLDGPRDVAAISSEMAAKVYGVPVLRRDIQDRNDNTTRFLIIEQRSEREEDRSRPEENGDRGTKSLIVFTVSHTVPGALVKALGILMKHGLNMTGIQQRPPDEHREEDAIFVETEGTFAPTVIDELEEVTGAVRWLGSWQQP